MNLIRTLRDPRDLPLLHAIIRAAAFVAFAVALYFLIRADVVGAWVVLPYALALWRVLGPFVLMQHHLMHRKTFVARYAWIDSFVTYVLNPFFGQTFRSYSAHHLGMHHAEGNGAEDLSTTLPYRRDSARDFARYFVRFFWTASYELPRYLYANGRRKLARGVILGELGYAAVVAAAFAGSPGGALLVFVFPLLVVRFAMISGNWVQHAFIDESRLAEPIGYSITCIDTPYNALCFNDGYHIQHHERPAAHYTELPVLFEASRERLLASGAVIFRGLDYFQIWALLMVKAHRRLAGHLVVRSEVLAGRSAEDFLRARLGA